MGKKARRKNLGASLREAMAMAKLAQAEDKYGNKWGMQPWPMNDAYCSYKGCDFTQTVAVALAGQKCPHCRKPLSWAGKWYVDKEIKLEDGRKKTVQVLKYREPLGKWKDGYVPTNTENTPENSEGDRGSSQLLQGGHPVRDKNSEGKPGRIESLNQSDGMQK